MIASLAAPVSLNALQMLFPRETASTLLTPISALIAALVRVLVPLAHLPLSKIANLTVFQSETDCLPKVILLGYALGIL